MDSEEIKKNIAVSSRLKYVTNDRDIKVVDFIIGCSFKDDKQIYTNGTIMVPLYRVLDAMIQNGEPYNESN